MSRRNSKRHKKRKIVLLVVEILVLLLLLGVLYVVHSLNQIQKADVEPEKLAINTNIDTDSQKVLSGYTDIAIFGVDNRSNGDTESGNSDVIMIASINNDTKEVKVISVYRDTYLNTEVYDTEPTFHKANRAYAQGGAQQAMAMLNTNLDLDIENYVTVDFKAVTDIIDILGGVEINVDDAELEWINSYIDTTAKVTGATSSHISSPGTYNLDGTQATAYCRIRYTAGNDFARAQRQREVMTQIIKKLQASDLSTLNTVINKIFPEVTTSYSNTQILSMAASMLDYQLDGTTGFPFNKATTDLGGSIGSIVVPCDLSANVEQLHRYLYDDTDYLLSNTVQEYSDEVLNQTGDGIDSGDNPDAVSGGSIEMDTFSDDGNSSSTVTNTQ